MLDFFMEYSAGLIQTAQPLYAIKLLSIATERNEAIEIAEWTDDNAKKSITNKGIILALMGLYSQIIVYYLFLENGYLLNFSSLFNPNKVYSILRIIKEIISNY